MVTSRDIFSNRKVLRIIIDSESFNRLLNNRDIIAYKILKYSSCPLFDFLRTPFKTENKELIKIPELHAHSYGDNISERDIECICKEIFKKCDKQDLQTTTTIFNLAFPFDHRDLFITNNKVLLKKRLWLESRFSYKKPCIITIEEAREIMDLFLKYNKKYLIAPNFSVNEGYWYLLFFRTLVPYFNYSGSILNSFANRFIYLLKSVDLIGFQYYLGVSNDTFDNMIYYFNYAIVLITGIFDSLAIETKNKYNLKFSKDDIPSRTSLNPRAGKDFLKALEEKNPELHTHVRKYLNFINVIYKLREKIIHREMIDKITVFYKDYNDEWQNNLIKIDNGIHSLIMSLNDKKKKYDPFTQWGLYKVNYKVKGKDETEYFLEPFNFIKMSTKTLAYFSNNFLKLLGYNNFVKTIEAKKQKSDFIQQLKIFKKYSLAYI